MHSQSYIPPYEATYSVKGTCSILNHIYLHMKQLIQRETHVAFSLSEDYLYLPTSYNFQQLVASYFKLEIFASGTIFTLQIN